MQKQKRDVYQEVTDKIIEAMESNKAPWLKPWEDAKDGSPTLPYNAASGGNYHGVNLMLLSMLPYSSNAFVTYKQAQKLGGNVKKGEKGHLVIFWKFIEKTERDGNGRQTKERIPLLKHFTVFNLDQCEGINADKIKSPEKSSHHTTGTEALDLVTNTGATVNHGGDVACFMPSQDIVCMPHQTQFKSEDHYSATLLHEATHWTGHKSRLDRDFSGRFGSEAYAFEELVAELGSAYLCASLNIRLDNLQHPQYLANWLRVLKSDKKAIFTASSKAAKAADFILTSAETQAEAA